MENLGKKIKDARMKLNLSVKELSEKTKVRQFVIEAIEKEDFSIMPEVYIKSFVKTLCTYLKIEIEAFTPPIKAEKPKKKNFDDEKIESEIPKKPKLDLSIPEFSINDIFKSKKQETDNFTEIFKRKKLDKDKRYNYLNKTIYIILILAVLAAVYFAFTSLNKNSSSTHIQFDTCACFRRCFGCNSNENPQCNSF